MSGLSLEEKATNYDTMRHIERVRNLINFFVLELLGRGEEHDQTKLEAPELPLFVEYTSKLAETTYGSPEYEEFRKKLKPALDHHYAKYRHHPEHFPDGIAGMNLIDLVELFVDWKAASERHNDGNILKSIEKNCTRFEMSPQLKKIFDNTAELFDS